MPTAEPAARRLRIGVFGAGSIGCYVGGRLMAAGAADVVLVGRPRQRDVLAAHGLVVQDFDGPAATVPAEQVAFATATGALADCDVVLCCVKSQHTADAARELATVLRPDCVVASLQNGVRNPDTLREHLGPRLVVASIVTWNVVVVGHTFRRATSGPLMIEATAPALAAAVRAAGIPVEVHADLAPEQWTKLLVNLNNAVSALSDASTATLLLTPGYRRAIAALVAEGLRVVRASGVRPARWNGVPLGLMPKVLRLPTPLVRLVTRAQLKVDPAARSSMWQDLDARRPTEVDYLNGEIVRVAEAAGGDAPLNRRIVALIRAAEAANLGSPALGPDALWQALTAPAP
ncbi:MAG: 2-dehydropantoate 2-reductase [Kofleriaceae bacterium]